MSAITDFLDGTGPDAADRSLETVLAFGPSSLERHHDFIQWLFPLAEPSLAVPGSPVLTEADIIHLQQSQAARRNLARAAAQMAHYYAEGGDWLRPHDHNHLRITRIIKSLRLLAGDAAADAFRDRIERRVENTRAPVSPATRAYWARA